MSTQIAVRLQDDAVHYLDSQVAEGKAASRADLIDRLIDRERRRQRDLNDLEIMRKAGFAGYPDLAGVAEATSRRPLDLA
jgi:metal-responsive CopG/Arc/MetJ family transcriptional regulator